MEILSHRARAAILAALSCIVAATSAPAQQTSPTPTNQQDEVIRIATSLVQTDVTVVDRRGSAIDGLKREQFELRIDKKPRPILFFERVRAGSANEQAQLAAARGEKSRPATVPAGGAVPMDRGRTVFFYLDDLHLSHGSMDQARKMLVRFIDKEMGQNDEVAIVSASGQVGFLQQMTDNKSVLRFAAGRLRTRPYAIRDGERPPMSEHQALLIENNDPGVLGYFVEELVKQIPGISNPDDWVRGRASRILAQAAQITNNTMISLESLIASSKALPGRKLLFFISDGFFLDSRRESYTRFRNATSEAARSGVVIYTIDARGLIASLTDASSQVASDPTGRLAKAELGEISSTQDALNALARDTGGKPLFNTNDLSSGVTRALKETSAYYLIAWQPDTDEQRSGKFSRIEVSVIGRPDLVVQLRRTIAAKETPAPVARKTKNLPPAPAARQAEDDLRTEIKKPYPGQTLPTALGIEFLDAPGLGPTLTVGTQVTLDPETFTLVEGKRTANVDVGGVVYDTSGKAAANFRTRITAKRGLPEGESAPQDSLAYSYPFKLKPGLYQVRVAARDVKTGRTGSARQWIEVPDLAARKLALSSLILGKRNAVGTELIKQASGPAPADLSIDHRFQRTSNLRFLAFVYNAARPANKSAAIVPDVATDPAATASNRPDVAIQVQVLRDDQPVLTTTMRRIDVHPETDVTRLPYAAELPLSDLLPGRYWLQVTVIDRIAKTSATQQTRFAID